MMRRRLRHRGPGLEPDCAAISGPMPLSSLRPGDAGRVLAYAHLLTARFGKGTGLREGARHSAGQVLAALAPSAPEDPELRFLQAMLESEGR